MTELSRRQVMGGLAAGAASAALLGSGRAAAQVKVPMPKNEDFYSSDGTFDAEAGKRAFYAMMAAHGYPIPERLRGAEFWAIDFGLGKFTEVGMAGIFWVNSKEHDYFGHEIFLLPGQMIPEHKHVKTADARPKMEAWHVRHGWIHIYGEGAPTAGVAPRIPPTHKDCCVARTEQKLLPGEVGMLAGPEQWHWMKAGPEGAIVSEYASYHDGNALRFSHPKVAF